MEKKERLIVNIFEQVETYLKEIGEFAPFGSVIDSKEKVTPLGYYSDEDIIDSSIAIENLQENIKSKIERKQCCLGAIGVNVSVSIEGKLSDALLLRVTNDGVNWSEDYYTYKLDANNLNWT